MKQPQQYEVGYGKPPVHSRFRKGQSGNPGGHRREPEHGRAMEVMREEAYRLVTVREGDKVLRMPALQVMFRSTFLQAAKGNGAALRAVLNALRETEAELEQNMPVGSENSIH